MKVYSWGSGNLGQLGIGNTDDSVSKPTLMLLPNGYEGDEYKNVKDINGGGCHTMMIVDDDDLYTFGSNDSGQLGYIVDDQKQTVPKLLDYFKINSIRTNKCAGGWGHSLACDINGNIYSWGSNSHFQLGIDTTTTQTSTTNNKNNNNSSTSTTTTTTTKKRIVFKKKKIERKNVYEPKLIELFINLKIKIVNVSCGMRHSIALSNDGKVYGWGCNKFGQLSNSCLAITGDETIQDIPKLLELNNSSGNNNFKISQISCGFQHTVLLDDSFNYIISFGQNKFGQLGNSNCIDQSIPFIIDFSKSIDNTGTSKCKIKEIQCGWSNSCILTNNGRLFICGRGEYGTLGDGNKQISNEFKLLNSTPFNEIKIKNFSIGSEHILIQTELNDIYSFGWNEHYQLGLCEDVIIGKDGENKLYPMLLPSIKGNDNSIVKTGNSGHSFFILP